MLSKKKFWRRVVSIMMVVLMVAGGLSQSVLAEGTIESQAESKITNQEAKHSENNVKGKLTKVGQTLPGVSISVHTNQETPQWFEASTDSDGKFELFLNDGDYVLDGVWLPAEEKWYGHEVAFKVANGKLQGLKELNIDLKVEDQSDEALKNESTLLEAGMENISGKVVNGATPITNNWVSFENTTTKIWANAKTNEAGAFTLGLADGNYQIQGIYVETEGVWYEKPITFSIANGVLVGQPELLIDLKGEPTAEVSGKVVKGTTPVTDVWVSVKTTGENVKWFKSAVRTDAAGAFTINLPDGEYQLDGIFIDSEQKWYEKVIVFTVAGGQLSDHSQLQIDVQTESMASINGKVLNGSTPISGVYVSPKTTGVVEKWFLSEASTDPSGAFTIQLPDGEYQLDGIFHDGEQKWYPKVVTFIVANGKLDGQQELLINVQEKKAGNISGKVVNGTTPISGVWVSPKTTGTVEKWLLSDAPTDATGAFALSLPDGEYQLDGIFNEVEQKWYPKVINFTVADGKLAGQEELLINLGKENTGNVSGKVVNGETPVTGVWVSPKTTGTGERWFLSNARTDATGAFTIDLPDGEYQLDGIFNEVEQKWYPKVINFTVADGKLAGQDELLINLSEKNTGNVKGKVVNGETPVSGVWVSPKKTGPGERWFLSNTRTDATGAFTIDLPDGEYQLEGIYHEAEQKWYPNVIAFSVVDGNLAGQTELLIDLQPKTIGNVSGTIFDGTTPVTNAVVYLENYDEFDFYQVETDEAGNFTIQLNDGTYHVVSVETEDGEEVYTLKKFSVVGGKLMINDIAAEKLDVTLPPVSLTLEISEDGNPIEFDSLDVLHQELGYYYWGYPDKNGRVSFRLPDGIYEVVGYYGMDLFYYNIYQQVEVVNGTTNPSPFIINVDTNETAFGVVSDENGPIRNAEFYIEDVDNNTPYYVQADRNGQYGINLQDGNYFIHEINSGISVYAAVDMAFSVSDGKVYLDGVEAEALDIKVPVKSLTGKLLNNGNSLSGEISFERVLNGTTYFYTGKTDAAGNISLRVPDGTYTIKTVYGNFEWYDVHTTVTVANGATVPNPLVIDVNKGNVKGLLKDVNGSPLAYSDFFIDSVSDDSYYWVQTNDQGEFTSFVPDGNYFIHEIGIDMATSYPDLFFSIVGGKVHLDGTPTDVLMVNAIGDSLNAKVVDNETPLSGDVFASREVNGVFLDYWAEADEGGKFTLRVADGVYSIDSLFNENGMYEFVSYVEVKNGTTNPSPYVININALSGTLQGSVQDVTGRLSNGVVTIERYSENGVDGWYYADTSSNGEFGLDLPNGTYKIIEFEDSEGIMANLDLDFTIENYQLNVAGVKTDKLTVTVPSITYQGTLLDGEIAVADADVYLVGPMGDILAYTNNQGGFSARLQDGPYTVDVAYFGDEVVNINQPFEIVDGNLVIQDVLLPAVNVQGQLSDGGFVLAGYELSIYDQTGFNYRTLTSSEGTFTLRLPDGDYVVHGASIVNDDFEFISYPLNVAFTIADGMLQGDDLVINLPQATLHVKIVYSNQPVVGAEVRYFRELNGETTYFYATTDADGFVSSRIPDGVYTLDNILMADGYLDINQVITVENGTTSPNPIIIDISGL